MSMTTIAILAGAAGGAVWAAVTAAAWWWFNRRLHQRIDAAEASLRNARRQIFGKPSTW